MIIFSKFYIDINMNSTQEIRDLIYAISADVTALAIHFLKEWRFVKNNESVYVMFSSLELLVLIMAPILGTFQIIRHDYPQLVVILSAIGVFSWWIITVYRTTSQHGKATFELASIMYAGLLAYVGIAALIVSLIK